MGKNADSNPSNDEAKIKWSSGLRADFGRGKIASYFNEKIRPSLYRPYSKQWLYFDSMFNERMGKIPYIYPSVEVENLAIYVSGKGEKIEFSALMIDSTPNLHMISSGQCFPLKLYEMKESSEQIAREPGLFDDANENEESKYEVRDGITDAGLKHFQDAYPDEKISKEDLFYYVYGLLHSDDYKSRYADNLTKELPRIPRVTKAADFWAFSKAGRALADLHIGYEDVKPYPVQIDGGTLLLSSFTPQDFRVVQMKFAKGKNGERHDKTRVIFNHKITMSGIPLEAYEYVVNGKPALEWVMERQAVSEHKDSGIVNDANLWATETMKDASYPLKLFQRVITVSLETMKIVNSLPKIN
uniref:type ISP restriction/modification enzyme n=1 Tax=Aerococcus urinaeequi TaxID=51665 RepID=UPI00352A626E